MTTITVDQLESSVRDVLAELARGGEAVAITLDGAVVARLTPAGEGSDSRGEAAAMTEEEVDAFWAPWRRVWEVVGDRWPEGVSAVDAVREQRRG